MTPTNILFTLSLVLATSLASHAQVGIGTSTPNASAALDITSTTKGLLPPRMTRAQRNVIAGPVQGLMVYCTNCGANGEAQLYNGTAWVNLVGVSSTPNLATGEVYNPTTNEVWMDRNVGALQVATSSTDAASYGDLYQWGRGTDGHQIRTSTTTSTLSSTDTPGSGDFILPSNTFPYDWRSPQNVSLWQGVNGINNPCLSGYRIPTESEWNAERLSWNANSSLGAFDSPLKLPLAGYRRQSDGSPIVAGSNGLYWSSTVSSVSSRNLDFSAASASVGDAFRAHGLSVRCIKN